MKMLFDNKQKTYTHIIGLLSGIIAFFALYDWQILDSSNINWLMEGDPGARQMGWHFFRNEPWTFPFGAIKNYSYPIGTSLAFTDVMPLIGLFFKLFKDFLPQHFQYLGLWTLLCYILMGILCARLIRKFTSDVYITFIGTLLLVSVPIIFFRGTGHSTLLPQWMIIASFLLYFDKYNLKAKIYWSLLLSSTILICIYFTPMIWMVYMAYLFRHISKQNFKNRMINIVLHVLINIVLILICMWISGHFIFNPRSASVFGYGAFSTNLLALINPYPLQNTTFLPWLPVGNEGQYEGFSYLGMGLLLLLLLAVYISFKNKYFSVVKKHYPLFLAVFLLFIFSLSNKIYLGDILLFDISYPSVITKLGNVFRSTGRFVWPIYYLIILYSLYIFIKFNKKKISYLFLSVVFVVQAIDLYPAYHFFKKNKMDWWEGTQLKSKAWSSIFRHIDHVCYNSPFIDKGNAFFSMALKTADHGKTLNAAWLARQSFKKSFTYKAKLKDSLHHGQHRQNTLYIIEGNDYFLPKDTTQFHIGILDGYQIVLPKNPDYKDISLKPWPYFARTSNTQFTLNEVIENNLREGCAVFLQASRANHNYLPDAFIRNMKVLGSNIAELKDTNNQYAYAGLIMNGKLTLEKFSKKEKETLKYNILDNTIEVISTLTPHSNAHLQSAIRFNGIDLAVSPKGINVLVYDFKNDVLTRYNYDYYYDINALYTGEIIFFPDVPIK